MEMLGEEFDYEEAARKVIDLNSTIPDEIYKSVKKNYEVYNEFCDIVVSKLLEQSILG